MGRDGRRTVVAVVGVLILVAVPLGHAAAAAGDIVTIAGTGIAGFSGDGGPAVAASLASPGGLALDSGRGLLIADEHNHAIRRIAADGTIATVAGTGGVPGYAGDGGIGTAAMFDRPRDVAVRPNGAIYVADTGNHVIRSLVVGGATSTIVGTGTSGFSGDGGTATAAQLDEPSAIAARPNGVLFIADAGNDSIRMVGLDGVISTIAGSGAGDGNPGAAVRLDDPRDVAVRANGTVYIADTGNHRLLKVDHVTGKVTTIAGTGAPGYSGDGGPAAAARMRLPEALTIASDGSILVADTGNHVIRRINPSGTITTLVGIAQPFVAASSRSGTTSPLNAPRGVLQGVDGSVLLSDSGNHKIRQVKFVPTEPVFTATTPASPASSLQPLLVGTADQDTTIRIYSDPRCSGHPAAIGTAAEFASPGLRVTVPADSTTRFHATATDRAETTSACSVSAVTYVAEPPPRSRPPQPTTTPPSPTPPPLASAPQEPPPVSDPDSETIAPAPPRPLARPVTPVKLAARIESGAPPEAAPDAQRTGEAVAPARQRPVYQVRRSRSEPEVTPPKSRARALTLPGSTGVVRDSRHSRTGVVGMVARAAGVVGDHADKAVLPSGLFAAMVAFFGVQNQIDRRDPKLALAPVQDEPDLEFLMTAMTPEDIR